MNPQSTNKSTSQSAPQSTFNPTPEESKLAWRIVYLLVEQRGIGFEIDEALKELDRLMEDRDPCGLVDVPARSQADATAPSGPSLSPSTPASTPSTPSPSSGTPIAALRLAKGWEDKLLSVGVSTIESLADFIDAGKLTPGCLPRIGPEAVEKIKSALASYDPDAGPSVVYKIEAKALSINQDRPEGSETIYEAGKRFAATGKAVTSNPFKVGTREWAEWDRGWQEQFASMEVSDEATMEEGPSDPPTAPDAPSDAPAAATSSDIDLPELDLSSVPASPAPLGSTDGADDEFADL